MPENAQSVKPLQKVLIANRGEIAVRVIRACKRRRHRQRRGLRRPRPRRAASCASPTRRYALGGATPADSYLDIDKIVDAAAKSGADAVHPGYGFLAENADFAQAVIDAGLTWIGPPPAAIEALGDKVEGPAHRRARRTPRWRPAPRTRSPDADEVVAFAEGARPAGRHQGGVRRRRPRPRRSRARWRRSPSCSSPRSARRSRRSAAASASSRSYLDQPRHVETQCLADQHGNVVVVSTRDCSLQRRHQKLVEEAPAPFLTDDQIEPALRRRRRRSCARPATSAPARASSWSRQDGTISFLEVNTRLQVEHPRLRGGHRHRPGARDVPDRRRRGARLRRPARSAGTRSSSGSTPRTAAATSCPRPGTLTAWSPPQRTRRAPRRRLRGRRDRPGRVRLADRQADRHRPRPHPGAGALAPGPRRVRRRRHADGDPVPPRRRRATRRSRRRRRGVRGLHAAGSRPTSTTRSSRTPASRRRGRRARASGRRSPSRSAAGASRSCCPAGLGGRRRRRHRWREEAASARRARRPAPPSPATPSPPRCRAPSSRSPSPRATPWPRATSSSSSRR